MTPRTGTDNVDGAGRPAGVGLPGAAEPMLMYLVKQVELAVRSHLDDLLRPVGLTALQYTALTVLERQPDLSSAQLARNSFVTAQSMADMITALEERGLIERHRDRADRRRLVVALTARRPGTARPLPGPGDRAGSRMLHGLTKPRSPACAAACTPATPT